MTDFTKKFFPALLLLFTVCFGTMTAQVPFWLEEFDGGLPADWSAVEVVGDASATSNWMHTTVGPTGAFPVAPLNSTSAANGWMIFDSDLNCSGEQDVWLVSPQLDLADKDIVVLQFETFYRRFNDLTYIEVSTDSMAWTSIEVFEGIINNDYGDGTGTGDENPQIVTMNLSQYAANQGSFWFAFHFLSDANTVQGGDPGCGYTWQVDNVGLLDVDPTPDVDLSMGDFFYPPRSFAQPVSQIDFDTMFFQADISNIGLSTVTNVVVKVEVLEGNNLLFVDSMLLEAIDTSVTDSTVSMPELFVPILDVGDYNIRYSTYSLDAPDADMSNNVRSDPFIVTDNLFAKEDGATIAFRPGVPAGSPPVNYIIGNLYETSNLLVDKYAATNSIFFATKNTADGNLSGDVTNILVFEIDDEVVLPDWSNFDPTAGDPLSDPQFILRSFNIHTWSALGTQAQEAEPLVDFDDEDLPVELKPGKRYFLCGQYEGDNNVIFHGFNQDWNYFQISTVTWDGGDNQWFLGGFGVENSAVMRMEISLLNTTDEKPLPDEAMNVYPNPVSDILNVEIQLEKPSITNITIADLTGKVIKLDEFESLQEQTFQYDVSQFPSGTYLVRVATEEGTKTQQFIVQH